MKRIGLLLLAAFGLSLSTFAQGSLTPPGAPAPTMVTLSQIEPRTPISALPATITTSGSYYVTSNLTCTACAGGTNGITITSSDVTLDLSGFPLEGIAGSGSGVIVSGSQTNLAIMNGTIGNWGGTGLDAGGAINSQFNRLRLSGNGVGGLIAGQQGLVAECTAFNNTGVGINAGTLTVVRHCTANFNTTAGFVALTKVQLTACLANHNTTSGINAGGGCAIVDCIVNGNTSTGIVAFGNCLIKNCIAVSNTGGGIQGGNDSRIEECVVTSTQQGDGIVLGFACVAERNHCNSNGQSSGGAGIHATGNQNRIEANKVTGNGRGIVTDLGGNLIVKNSSSGNVTNYFFTGTQTFGPTNNLADSTGLITNQNPWANFPL
jgi:hypothetical protein